MTELQKAPRMEQSRIGRVCAPLAERHTIGAELGRLYRRGELASSFAIRQEICPEHHREEWIATYVRLRDPRRRLPRWASVTLLAASALAGLGLVAWMVYESRYVIGAALAITAGAILTLIIYPAARSGGRHCPGC